VPYRPAEPNSGLGGVVVGLHFLIALVEAGPDVVGRICIPLADISPDQHATCGHPDNTRESDPFPRTVHTSNNSRRSIGALPMTAAFSLSGVHPKRTEAISLDKALESTRTGDVWLFRGKSGPDRAIQALTNSPVNHVAMAVVLDDLPPLMWHAELGNKLTDMWTGTNHRGVQLNDAREAALQWMEKYGQRCWIRQITPMAGREQEDLLLKVIARMDGTAFPTTARLAGRWFKGRVPTVGDITKGVPVLDKTLRKRIGKRRDVDDDKTGLETAYCAEVVAMTYEAMGLLETEKRSNWFDPGRFWSGDKLPMAPGYALGAEIAVEI
jgi:hypothetical protein